MNFTLRIKNSSLLQQLLIIVYRLLLDLVYIFYIHPTYNYSGMHYDFSFYKYLISLGFVFMISLTITNLLRKEKISYFVLLLLNIMYFIPTSTLYALGGISDSYFLYLFLYWLALSMIILFGLDFNFKNIKVTALQSLVVIFIVLVITFGVIYITGKYNDFNIYIGLKDVYKLRFAQRELNLPSWVVYFQPIAATLSPVFMIYFFIKKRYLVFGSFIFIQLLLYGFGANKSTLFILVIALLICFISSLYFKKATIYLFISLSAAVFIEVGINKLSHIATFVHNRMLFIPTILSYNYFDFFSNNELLYLRESILRNFGFNTNYALPTRFLINKVYYGNTIDSANNGLCGDAFSNFGWISFVIYPVIIGFFIKCFDAVSRKLNSKLIVLVSLIISLGLINGSFFSLLLTNGFFFLFVILYLQTKTN